MEALATKKPSDGKSLEKKVKELASKPPTIEVMRELVAAMLTEIRLSVPNFETLFSLLPEVENVHRALVLEVTGALIQTAKNIQKGNHEHAFDESLPAKSAEVQALMAELTASLNARAAELRSIGESPAPLEQHFDSGPEIAEDTPMTDLSRQEVDAKLAASEAKVDARLANFDTSIKTGFAELRAEMAKQSADMRVEMANSRAEMHKNTTDLLKWGATFTLAAVGSTVGLLTYLNKANDKPSQPQTSPPAASAPSATVAPPPVTSLPPKP